MESILNYDKYAIAIAELEAKMMSSLHSNRPYGAILLNSVVLVANFFLCFKALDAAWLGLYCYYVAIFFWIAAMQIFSATCGPALEATSALELRIGQYTDVDFSVLDPKKLRTVSLVTGVVIYLSLLIIAGWSLEKLVQVICAAWVPMPTVIYGP